MKARYMSAKESHTKEHGLRLWKHQAYESTASSSHWKARDGEKAEVTAKHMIGTRCVLLAVYACGNTGE